MARLTTLSLARTWLKARPKDAHKGISGRVLIVAGSKGMAGAAVLTAMGAVRSGAGLVKVATVQSQQPIVAKRAPLEVTSAALFEDRSGCLSSKAWPQIKKLVSVWRPGVIAAGPGLGSAPAVAQIVHKLLSKSSHPVVLDADGLTALKTWRSGKKHAPFIMTPHEGELARLFDTTPAKVKANREHFVNKAALKFDCVCLLKGRDTLVSDGRSVWKNTTGNPAMASGGMGDVLTGIIAALWANGELSALQSATLGAFLHGFAGDLAVKKFPERSLLASDLVSYLPDVFKKVWRNS